MNWPSSFFLSSKGSDLLMRKQILLLAIERYCTMVNIGFRTLSTNVLGASSSLYLHVLENPKFWGTPCSGEPMSLGTHVLGNPFPGNPFLGTPCPGKSISWVTHVLGNSPEDSMSKGPHVCPGKTHVLWHPFSRNHLPQN